MNRMNSHTIYHPELVNRHYMYVNIRLTEYSLNFHIIPCFILQSIDMIFYIEQVPL